MHIHDNVPTWLQGVWERAYITQTFRKPKTIDDANLVRYVQTPILCADMRLTHERTQLRERSLHTCTLKDLRLIAEAECFAGATQVTSNKGQEIVSWYPVYQFPPSLEDDPHEAWCAVQQGTARTEDVGAVKIIPGASKSEVWLEQDVDTGASLQVQ
jgi:hypothetical protein